MRIIARELKIEHLLRVSSRIINFTRLDTSKLINCTLLSIRDRDIVVDEAQEHQDDIESYDEARDCLPDLSDIAPTFYLLGLVNSVPPRRIYGIYIEQREFVYRIIVDSRRHKVIL